MPEPVILRGADLVEAALGVAMFAHLDQTDRQGMPYLLHPFAVAASFGRPDEIAVALMHDALEDAQYSATDLREMGFPHHVVDAVCMLTRDKTHAYDEYIARLRASDNRLAIDVKLADLKQNLRMDRRFDGDHTLRRRYHRALRALTN